MTHPPSIQSRLMLALAGLLVATLATTPHVLAQDASAPEDISSPPSEGSPDGASEAAPAATAPAEETPPSEIATSEPTTSETTAEAQAASTEPAAPPAETSTELASPTQAPEEPGDGAAPNEDSAPSEDEAQAAEAQAAAEPLAWRNSFFSYSVAATFNSLCRDCQLSYNPNVYQFFSLTPRWYVDASTFFFFSLGAFYEFTDADGAAYNHEFQIGDLLVELRRTIAWEGFIFIPAVRLTFPTSKLSQAAQRYANAGLGVTIVRPIPEALGMTIAVIGRYQHWFADSNVSLARGECLTPLATGGGADAATGSSGAGSDTSYLCNGVGQNESDRIVAGVSINVTPVEHLTVTLSLFWVWAYTFGLAAADVDTTAGPVRLEAMGGSWRNFTSYSVGVAYDFTEWLNVSLSVSNSTVLAPLWNDDGSLRSPFNPDTQFALGATFTLDGIYNTITAGGEDDGLTPEERQRRRQGLAQRDGGDDGPSVTAATQPTTL